MIEKIIYNSVDIDIMEEIFKDILRKGQVKKDVENNKFTNYLIYKQDNKIVAFINYDMMYERAEIININVLKDFQNQKIASQLLEKMIEDCIRNQVKSITLEVRKNNESAIHLYKKYGFIEISIRDKYYHGIDGILMEKVLC